MAVATVQELSFSYESSSRPALSDVSLTVAPGEVVVLAGRSGCGKTTLIRALAGLVPHFHGGRFTGRVSVGGQDTRQARPAELAGTVATLFQDPEDQIVFGRVLAEVSFGIENSGAPAAQIESLAHAALDEVGAGRLVEREIAELSGGELQRVCLASTLALRPALLLLDEPTSQLDVEGARSLIALVRRLARERGTAIVLSEHRLAHAQDIADRVIRLDGGRVVYDGPPREANEVSAIRRKEGAPPPPGEILCRLDDVDFRYREEPPVLTAASLALRRGEIVALTGPNGSGKSTLGKLAAGLLEPDAGTVVRTGRASYLTQDPGDTSRENAATMRWRLGRETAQRLRGRLSRSAWPATRAVIRVTCRVGNGRGSRSPPCSPPSPTCSCSTSRRAESIRRRAHGSRACCEARRPAAPPCS